jgi:hypothetical protein
MPGRSMKASAAERLRLWAGHDLRQRTGWVGLLARAASGPLPQGVAARTPYVDLEHLFADEQMQERCTTVAPWYRPWGAKDVLTIRQDQGPAVRAARELYKAGLLRRLASCISTAQLIRDRRLANAMQAMGGAAPEAVWDVYEVADQHLTRWLLSQPLEARQSLLPYAQ